MILGEPPNIPATQQGRRNVAIDEVFRRIARKHPQQLALIDAPNREAFTDGPPRRLTYAEADHVVWAIAGRLRCMGLPTDAVIGIQLPNIVEGVLTILGVLRAGMIAAPMPLLWRRADAVAALSRVGAKALITCGHVGGFNHSHLAMRVASEVFSIRYVCGFGAKLPDGVVLLGDLFSADRLDPVPPPEGDRLINAAAHLGLITFETGENGIVPVARNHLELLAGGVSVALESRLAKQDRILSTIPPSSFAGISVTLMPWLLSAGTLSLHHPFDADVLAQQGDSDNCGTLVLPGPVALRLSEAGAFADRGAATMLGVWRSPDYLAESSAWRDRAMAFVDVPVFGEAGLIAVRRDDHGRPAPIPFGPIEMPRGSASAMMAIEVVRTPGSTIALRGPMVPRQAFPPGVEHSGLPHLKIDHCGLVDTGYYCRIDSLTKAMVIVGPPAGIVSVGGYRFSLHDLKEAVGRIDSSATLAALPDPVIGRRLIGNADKRDAIRAALNAVGVNPIVAAAFRDRSERAEAVRA
ncbi:MAG: AMP-binding protein [Xanthobacteraceae bacterium]